MRRIAKTQNRCARRCMQLNIAKLINMGNSMSCSSSSPMKIGSSCANIGILSLNEREDIHQFVKNHQKPGQIHLCEKTLEFKDLDKFKPPKEWNAVILLHSAKLGRLSLTDVQDARYDQLLKDLHTDQEIKLISVIAHDVEHFHGHSREEQLCNLKSVQESVFKYSENVIICDTLNSLHAEDLNKLEKFFEKVYRAVTVMELGIENAPASTEPDVEKEHEANHREVNQGPDESSHPASSGILEISQRPQGWDGIYWILTILVWKIINYFVPRNGVNKVMDAINKARDVTEEVRDTMKNELEDMEKGNNTMAPNEPEDMEEEKKTLRRRLEVIKKGKTSLDKVQEDMRKGLEATEKGKEPVRKWWFSK